LRCGWLAVVGGDGGDHLAGGTKDKGGGGDDLHPAEAGEALDEVCGVGGNGGVGGVLGVEGNVVAGGEFDRVGSGGGFRAGLSSLDGLENAALGLYSLIGRVDEKVVVEGFRERRWRRYGGGGGAGGREGWVGGSGDCGCWLGGFVGHFGEEGVEGGRRGCRGESRSGVDGRDDGSRSRYSKSSYLTEGWGRSWFGLFLLPLDTLEQRRRRSSGRRRDVDVDAGAGGVDEVVEAGVEVGFRGHCGGCWVCREDGGREHGGGGSGCAGGARRRFQLHGGWRE